MVPLGTLVSYTTAETAPLISHFNIFRSAEIDGSSGQGYSSNETIEALKDVAAKVLPQGYEYEFSGLSYEEIKAGSTTIYIFAFSITFVFLFLAALYESWSVPFSVLFAVPIGAFGAIGTLLLVPSLTNNVYAQIGLITLIGLAAKNAILIVEFAKVRVDRGEDLLQSTLEAVRLRLTSDYHDFNGIYSGCIATCVGNRCRSAGAQNNRLYRIRRNVCCINYCHIYCSGIICGDYKIILWKKTT